MLTQHKNDWLDSLLSLVRCVFGNLRRFGGMVWVCLPVDDGIDFPVGQGLGWSARSEKISHLFSIPSKGTGLLAY
jgi:hypothetical protein